MAKAPSLTKKQQKKALGHEKKKRITLKNVLCTPYCAKWPPLNASVDEDIRKQLCAELMKHSLRRPVVDKHLNKNERQEWLRKQREDPTEVQRQSVRDWLVCGVNAVTRAVERCAVSVVLVDRGAFTLTRHLIDLCAVRGCTLVPLTQLARVTAPLLSITQLSALAVRSGEGPFSAFVEFIKEKTPKVELPWLTLEDAESEEVTVQEPTVVSANQSSTLLEQEQQGDRTGNNVTKISRTKDRSRILGDFVCFDTDTDDAKSEAGSDTTRQDSSRSVASIERKRRPMFDTPLGFQEAVVSNNELGKRKRVKDKLEKTESGNVKKVKRGQNVKYHSANLHKLQGSENRSDRKQKRRGR